MSINDELTEIQNFFAKRQQLADSPEKRREQFKLFAQEKFGKVDEDTREYREHCQQLGVQVAFGSGLTRQEIIDILADDETQRILNNPSSAMIG